VQTGENWWFPRDMQKALSAGASDFAMLDVMKIGGITGWLRAAGQAEAASLPVSSHIFVETSAHALAVTSTAHWIEHLDIAGAVLAERCEVLDGTIAARGGSGSSGLQLRAMHREDDAKSTYRGTLGYSILSGSPRNRPLGFTRGGRRDAC
jgi:hypothetical protein